MQDDPRIPLAYRVGCIVELLIGAAAVVATVIALVLASTDWC